MQPRILLHSHARASKSRFTPSEVWFAVLRGGILRAVRTRLAGPLAYAGRPGCGTRPPINQPYAAAVSPTFQKNRSEIVANKFVESCFLVLGVA